MTDNTLAELQKALDHLQKEGHTVHLNLTDEVFAPCRAALAAYAGEGDACRLPVVCEEEERAVVSAPAEKDAPLLPLVSAMTERLFEECQDRAAGENERDLYRKSLAYIKEHYMEGITVADIAGAVGYSGSYFGYIFKKKHGIPVNRYVRELQLAKAKELLRNTSFSVSAVAEYVGYEDANYFSSLFKKQYGLSPMQYRNSRKNTAGTV